MADQGGVFRPRSGKVRQANVTLAHGAGGRAMRDLIEDVFLAAFSGSSIHTLEDQARLSMTEWADPDCTLAFTTDSFVVDPIFFPGGDIGKLAICGTVNDLAVGGARPVALSCSVILEEGMPVDDLRRISASMRVAAEDAGVQIVTGDTKVVPRGAVDKIFINTAGIGVIPEGRDLGARHIRPGDVILVSNTIGDHGAAIMAARDDLGLSADLVSDCRALNLLTQPLLNSVSGVRALRDATRGGVAAVLNEFAQSAGLCCVIREDRLPLKPAVRGISEILGLDPLYLANEGLFVAVVESHQAESAVTILRGLPGGEASAILGHVRDEPAGALIMKSLLGGERLVDMLDGDQLPRIC
ncbi:MAG: hydrogenase expression/formation protein HypE [Inquilinus sp.]|nr:hydrogenase expression/formation protein HypE [Inquilinus sp.]